jgi:hypothetical protein
MHRRSFFMLLGQTSVTAVLAAVLPALPALPAGRAQPAALPVPAPALVHGRLLRGTPQGRILESLDGGLSWQPIANFGPHCAILQVSEDRDALRATLGVLGHTFDLRSRDGRTWLTVGAPAPVV